MLNEREMRESRHVFETLRSLLVTKLDSTVSLTMLTRTWRLKVPSLVQILLNYEVDIKKSASNDLVDNN